MNQTAKGVNLAIRVNLTRKGMSQKQLAEETGMSLCYLNKRVNGHRSWSIDDLDAIASAMGIGKALDLLKLADSDTASRALAA